MKALWTWADVHSSHDLFLTIHWICSSFCFCVLFAKFGKVLAIMSLNIFWGPTLFLSSFWDSIDTSVGIFRERSSGLGGLFRDFVYYLLLWLDNFCYSVFEVHWWLCVLSILLGNSPINFNFSSSIFQFESFHFILFNILCPFLGLSIFLLLASISIIAHWGVFYWRL